MRFDSPYTGLVNFCLFVNVTLLVFFSLFLKFHGGNWKEKIEREKKKMKVFLPYSSRRKQRVKGHDALKRRVIDMTNYEGNKKVTNKCPSSVYVGWELGPPPDNRISLLYANSTFPRWVWTVIQFLTYISNSNSCLFQFMMLIV